MIWSRSALSVTSDEKWEEGEEENTGGGPWMWVHMRQKAIFSIVHFIILR